MNLRCLYCQTPFTLSRVELLSAIVTMNEKNQNHYDAHCPRCRRANSISRQRMELFFPNWREAAKQMASAPAAQASVSVTQKTEPLPKAAKTKATAAEKAKPAAAKRQRAGKPASVKKTTPAKSPAKSKTTAKPAAKPATKSKSKTTKK
jgi:hypothetical protein